VPEQSLDGREILAGYYKEAVPFGHPHFGVLFACACKLAEQAAQRIRAVDQTLARLTGGLGFLAATRLADIACDRPLDPHVEWCGVRADRDQQRESLDRAVDDRLDALLAVELLLIDDLGAEHKGGWNEQTLFEIIDTRYKQGRRTLITANIRRKDLSKRLASRIADMVGAEIWLVVSDLREIRLRERRWRVSQRHTRSLADCAESTRGAGNHRAELRISHERHEPCSTT
jgi:DNA replication protein DnaC